VLAVAAAVAVALVAVSLSALGHGGDTARATEAERAAAAARLSPERYAQEREEEAEAPAMAADRRKEAAEARAEAARRAAEARAEEAAAQTRRLGEQAGSGLGATRADFEAGNRTAEGTGPVPAGAVFTVIAVNGSGRVIAYAVRVPARPPLDAAQRLARLARAGLPTDAVSVRSTALCEDWRSPTLLRLIGTEYAEATTEAGSRDAQMQAVAGPGC